MATSLKRAPLEIHPQHHSFKLTCIALAATSTPTMTQNIEEGLHAPTLLEIFGSSLLGHASWCLFNVWRERIDEVATLYDESGNIPLPTIKTWKRWWYKLRWLLIMRCYVKGGTLVPIHNTPSFQNISPNFLGVNDSRNHIWGQSSTQIGPSFGSFVSFSSKPTFGRNVS